MKNMSGYHAPLNWKLGNDKRGPDLSDTLCKCLKCLLVKNDEQWSNFSEEQEYFDSFSSLLHKVLNLNSSQICESFRTKTVSTCNIDRHGVISSS